MAYIGAEPVPGQNREVDDISSGFNGNATAFTLQVNSVNVSPESAKNILVNLGGVLQNPDTDYTINASTLTFTTAPASGLSFFGLILGAGINTATVADGAITTSKLASDAVGANQLANTSVTAGSYTTADITVDAQGRITAAASGSISNAEIANNAVTTAKIADSTGASDGVTTAKLATDAVTAAKLADNAVVNASVDASAAIAGSKISPSFTSDITTTGDASINGGDLTVTGGEGVSAVLKLVADQGDDNGDGWRLISNQDDNDLTISNNISGSYADKLTLKNNGDLHILDKIIHDGDTNTAIRFPLADTFSVETSGTEAFRIDSSGRIGIGTSDHNSYNGVADDLIIARDSGHAGILIRSGTSHIGGIFFTDTLDTGFRGGFRYDHNTDYVRIDSNNAERMRINSSGNVGIGVTNIQDRLHIAFNGNTNVQCECTGTGSGANAGINVKSADGGDFFIQTGNAVSSGLRIYDATATASRLIINTAGRVRLPGVPGVAGSNLVNVSIESDGNLCTTTSIRAAKKNIATITDTSWLFNLNPVTFNWRTKTQDKDGNIIWGEDTDGGTQYGLIAEEVKEVKNDFCYYDNDGNLTGVHYDRLVAPLLKAIQDLKTENTALATRVAALESEVAALKAA